MIKQILKSTDPKLRAKSKPVQKIDKKIISLIIDLKDTLKIQEDPEGVGLAAPQIGKNVRVFIMKEEKGEPRVIINPEVLEQSGPKIPKKSKKKKPNILEGCLSLPHYYGPVKRSGEIKLKYQDENGIEVVKTFSDFSAQIIEHEIDHLNGILFTDKLLQQNSPLYEYKNGEWEMVEF